MAKFKLGRSIFSKRMMLVLLTGFSSGLPLLATGGTLQAWMTDQKVDLAVIGFFSLVGLPYTLKFLWSPLMDRYIPPFLGRRRGWMLVTQVGLLLALIGLSMSQPAQSPATVAILALIVAFFSASQDIVLDAYRRDILPDEELGLGSSLFVSGYRIAMLVSGAGALFLADIIPWNQVYLVLAGFMLVGILTSFWADEPEMTGAAPRSIQEAVVGPFLEFFKRKGALEILAFVLLYKLGEQMCAAMTTPFVLQLGFTKTEYSAVAKLFGMWATILGGLAGGVLIIKLSIQRALWIFGFLQMFAILGFSVLAEVGKSIPMLTVAVTTENFTSGMATSAYLAFMASMTNRRFSATQYALLSSLTGIPRVLASAPTGWMALQLGWTTYFGVCTLIAVPGMVLVFRMIRSERQTIGGKESA